MSIALDKSSEIILGIAITGIISTIVFLLKWIDRLDLETHDLKRDIGHLQRSHAVLSTAIAEIDKQNTQISSLSTNYYDSIDRRFGRNESRLYNVEKQLSLVQTNSTED